MLIPARDGKTDAVDGDRAFGYDVARKIFRNFHAEPPTAPVFRIFGIEMRHAAGAVDMPEDEVAPELFAGGQRLLQVDARTFFQCAILCAERSFFDGFAG